MNAKSLVAGMVAAVALVASPALVAQSAGQSLGIIRIPQRVVANGETLPAGSYTLRLSDASVTPVVGQSVESSHWVEFVQSGTVRGRELATVVTPAELKAVTDMTPPAPGAARIQMLRGGEYVRVWINRGGTQYLVHLSTSAAPMASAR